MINVKNIFHQYPGTNKYAVNDVSFSVNKGEIFGFLGPSGAGKSTVQNIMTKLLPLQRGCITYDKKPINNLGRDFFNMIGVSFEHPNLFLKLTGLENLKYHAGLYTGKKEDPIKLLETVGLGDFVDKPAGTYSKGMKQRLVFARSLINNPSILFLDEPTSGLDPAMAETIKQIIKKKKNEGTTIFLTTHNMQVADELCDNVAFINNGKIVAMDAPRTLKLKYGERSIKVEYRIDGRTKKETLFTEKQDDKLRINEILNNFQIETIHSQEATLEQIFIKFTGRGLS